MTERIKITFAEALKTFDQIPCGFDCPGIMRRVTNGRRCWTCHELWGDELYGKHGYEEKLRKYLAARYPAYELTQ